MGFSGSYGTKYESSSSPIAAFLKLRYSQKAVESLVDFETPTLNAMRKVDDLNPKGLVIPMHLDDPQGLGATWGGTRGLSRPSTSTHGSMTSGTKGLEWVVKPVYRYAQVIIDRATMMGMRKDPDAFFRARERDVNGVLAQFGRDLERSFWGASANVAGSLGTASNNPDGSAATVTLVTARHAIRFHEGMWIAFYSDSSGVPSSIRQDTGVDCINQVSSVNYETGVITFTANVNAAVAAGDHLVRAADHDLVGTAANRIVGIPTYIPSAAPSDTIHGLARANYSPQKVAGFRQSYLGSIEESVLALAETLDLVNKAPKTLWLSGNNHNRLRFELAAKGVLAVSDMSKGLTLEGASGKIAVKTSPYCPTDAGYLLDMDTWSFHTMGAVPEIVTDDGMSLMRVQSVGGEALDAFEIRIAGYGQLVCDNPFANGRVAIS